MLACKTGELPINFFERFNKSFEEV